MKNDMDIKAVIENKDIEVSFKPVVSVIKKSIIGFEVGSIIDTKNNNKFVIEELIESCDDELAMEVERVYREKSVENFSKIHSKNKELLLFLKISVSMIAKFIGSGVIKNLIEKFNINPENIVLEIVADKVEDLESLKDFIINYRTQGFLVALSDVGYGFANLDKISYIEPDIIKISGFMSENIHVDYYKQEIFKALINLSKSIGALAIGDGIMTKEEAITAVDLGADMIEGSYFGEFSWVNNDNIVYSMDKINDVAKDYKECIVNKANIEKLRYNKYDKVISKFIADLTCEKEENFNYKLEKFINENNIFECIYVLNKEGIQITDTLTNCKNMISQKALIFSPAKKGTDHSLKKYYYFLKNMELDKYVTEPYISLATGNLCITMSCVFTRGDNSKYILCIDFNPNDITI